MGDAQEIPPRPPAESEDSTNTLRGLIEAAQAGDRSALSRLFELHEPMMVRWARRRLGQPLRTMDETRDVLHDAYQVVLRKIDSFRFEDSRSFARWLRGIITRVILRKAGSPHLARRHPLTDEERVPDPDLTPMTRLSLEELKNHRFRYLKEYDRTDRLIYRLRTRGCSSQDIALRIGMSDRAVRMRYAKTDARLRVRMMQLVESNPRG